MIQKICKVITVFVLCFLLIYTVSIGADNDQPTVVTVSVEGMVTAGNTSIISRTIQTAEEQGAQAVVIKINTPGGLLAATFDIIQDILAAEVPIITYVTPPGGIAASAGAFILISGHVAAMSPATTTGAAMPVMMSPTGGSEPADDKTMNFLVGHIRSVATERERPADVAERFVTENLTLESQEALEYQVIDYIADNLTELLEMIHGKEVMVQGNYIILDTAGANILAIEMNAAERITSIISNPQVTFALFMLGIYGLIIGFSTPGTFVPEILGAVSLILALFGLGMFEVNILAGVLIIMGIGMIIAEVLVPSYGLLGIAGIGSIVLGSIFLPVEPMMPTNWFVAFRATAIGIGVVSGVLFLILLTSVLKIRKVKKVHGEKEFTDQVIPVTEDINPEGLVKINGEIWKAVSKDGSTISQGENVKVISRDGMRLIVEPIEKNTNEKEE